MPPRLFIDTPLSADTALDLPPGAARHVQVLRLQPGQSITLFNGLGGEWAARIERMGRSDVTVHVETHDAADRELPMATTLAMGMPANDRMDAVVEKATELGVATIQPLICERSVLRLSGERAQKKVAHWQAVAIAACEQSGRTRVPSIEPIRTLNEWLGALPVATDAQRWVLSLRKPPAQQALADGARPVVSLSGPEGGLAPGEEDAAIAAGFQPLSLGPRVLRADTAPLALLAHLALSHQQGPR